MTWYDDDEKRHYKSKYNFKTKSEAELWSADFQLNKKEIDGNTYFPEYFNDWYITYKAPSITNRTKSTYMQLINVLKTSTLSKNQSD
ncbi:Arm DNA-binding domain-containing protein [Pediococcus claussenii]|uniref:Arm DNA-binding domain-containing protein n=1 Tax=Pediococcus claussenii TaxID=187452 RepID=UPI001E4FE752|nr:Arm DNA-binding domain-containing protein [Pediococcus claussenii]